MENSENIQVGDRVLILSPSYVSGKYGIVRGQESNSSKEVRQRWLIQVEDEDSSEMLVSLVLSEFVLVYEQ